MDIEKLVKPFLKDIMIYEPGMDKEEHIKLSSNENPLSPHPHIVEAVTNMLKDANRYPPSGSPELTKALADHHGLTTKEICVGNGSNEIIDLLVRAFVNSDENVVYPVPSFIVYGLIAKICGCGGIGVDCKDFRLDLPAMRSAVNDKTRIVFICNPNNPTSTYVTAREVDAFLDGLPEDILVVMDEAYYDYINVDDYPDSESLRKKRNTIIILRTFSKFHSLAAVRVGYAIADPVVIQTLHRVRQPFNVNRIAQIAGLAALECTEELRPQAVEAMSERDRVREEVLKLGLECPKSQANFIFVDLGESTLDLYQELYDYGVIVRRMGQFGSSKNTYRVSIGTVKENDILIASLKKIFAR